MYTVCLYAMHVLSVNPMDIRVLWYKWIVDVLFWLSSNRIFFVLTGDQIKKQTFKLSLSLSFHRASCIRFTCSAFFFFNICCWLDFHVLNTCNNLLLNADIRTKNAISRFPAIHLNRLNVIPLTNVIYKRESKFRTIKRH